MLEKETYDLLYTLILYEKDIVSIQILEFSVWVRLEPILAVTVHPEQVASANTEIRTHIHTYGRFRTTS